MRVSVYSGAPFFLPSPKHAPGCTEPAGWLATEYADAPVLRNWRWGEDEPRRKRKGKQREAGEPHPVDRGTRFKPPKREDDPPKRFVHARTLTDDERQELALKAQADPSFRPRLAEECTGLILAAANRSRPQLGEDAEEVAMEAFDRAISTYDTRCGTRFTTWAYELMKDTRNARRKKLAAAEDEDALSFAVHDPKVESGIDDSVNYYDSPRRVEEVRAVNHIDALPEIQEQLAQLIEAREVTSEEARLFSLRKLDNLPLNDVAAEGGVKRRTASRMIKRVADALKD